MTTEYKIDLSNRIKSKVKELNELIAESNSDLENPQSRMQIKIYHQDWNPMLQTNGKYLNKYIGCQLSETLTY